MGGLRRNNASWRRSILPLVLAACAGLATTAQAGPLDEEFTYQGELRDAGVPANGAYDFRFRLYDAEVGGAQVGPQLVRTANVTDGRFVTLLQFGAIFNGQDRWLEVEASPAGAGAWVTLAPRQALNATPYAVYSMNAGSANTALTATTATNALALNGQAQAFYLNAGNLNAGVLPGARLTGAYGLPLSLTSPANVLWGNGANLTGLNANNITLGTIGDGLLSANVAFRNQVNTFTQDNTFSDNVFIAGAPLGDLLFLTDTTSGSAVRVSSSASDGLDNYGFRAAMANTAGNAYGLYLTNSSNAGRGAYISMTGDAINYGLYVVNSSALGYGGYFNNTSTTGTTYGLYTENNSPDGYGIFARHDAETGTGPAIYGETDSNTGQAYAIHGVVDEVSAGGGSAGVRGENRSTTGLGVGVYGTQEGTGYGVWGRVTGAGRGVYGDAGANGFGVFGNSDSGTGVRGVSGTSTGYGVYGSNSVGGRGVFGDAGGEGYGVYGSTDDGYAVYGIAAPTTTTEVCYGVRGIGGNSDNSYGGYFSVSGAGIGCYGYSTDSYGGYFDTGVSGGAALYVVGTASVGVLTIRGGADLAENFEVKVDPDSVKPGMVVMIDDEHEGAMELATGAYNKRVAGIVSGANELNAGMILGQFDGMEGGKPIALTGRVWTFVDASEAAVEPGDLLTTSDTPGYAMPVVDHSRAHGATIGKAMSKLAKGEKGMVLVLVNLQ